MRNGYASIDLLGDVIQKAKFALIPGLCQWTSGALHSDGERAVEKAAPFLG